MSQQASTHLIVTEPSEDLIASEPWSMETYAEGLMDELFADIDSILDSRGKPLPQTVQQNSQPRRTATAEPQEFATWQTLKVPVVVPQTIIRHGNLPPVHNRKNQLSTVVVDQNPVGKKVSKRRRKLQHILGKLLLVGATLGVSVAGIVWVVNSGLLNRLVSKSLYSNYSNPESPKSQPQSNLPTKADVEADLVNYMLGALAVIDRQEATKLSQKTTKNLLAANTTANRTALAYISARPTGNLPPVLAANNSAPLPNRSTTVVERIYIPVYQAPLPMRYAPPPVLLAPKPPAVASVPKKPAPVKTALNSVQKPSKPVNATALAAVRPQLKPVAVQSAPITLRQPKPPVLPTVSSRIAPPKLPAAKAPAPQPAATQQVVSVVPATSVALTHELQGVLDLPGKSAALFKIEGVSRRIDVGETIGSSGWTLVEVTKDEAVIRRNGEVRSIYAGQHF